MMHDEIAAAVDWWAEHLSVLPTTVVAHFKTALRTRLQQALAQSHRGHVFLSASLLIRHSPIRMAAHDAGIADVAFRFPVRQIMRLTHGHVVIQEGHNTHMIFPKVVCPLKQKTELISA